MPDSDAPKPWEIVGHITEIKIMMAEQSVMIKELQMDMRQRMKRDEERTKELMEIRSDLDKAKGSLTLLKWLIPSSPVLVTLILYAMKATGKL